MNPESNAHFSKKLILIILIALLLPFIGWGGVYMLMATKEKVNRSFDKIEADIDQMKTQDRVLAFEHQAMDIIATYKKLDKEHIRATLAHAPRLEDMGDPRFEKSDGVYYHWYMNIGEFTYYIRFNGPELTGPAVQWLVYTQDGLFTAAWESNTHGALWTKFECAEDFGEKEPDRSRLCGNRDTQCELSDALMFLAIRTHIYRHSP